MTVDFHRDDDFIIGKLKDGYSLSRYGDGEFKYLRGSYITNMQKHEPILADKLLKVFLEPLEMLLIGIPDPLCSRPFIEKFNIAFDKFIVDKPARQSLFVSSFVFRPNIINKDTDEYFEKIKGIWKGKEVVIVNFHADIVNHYLFKDSDCTLFSIPRNDCFQEYDRVLDSCRDLYGQEKIFLFSAGPTATALAYDICSEGEQGIDIGSLVFQYEQFKESETPYEWSYQDSYRKGKRGFLRGING